MSKNQWLRSLIQEVSACQKGEVLVLIVVVSLLLIVSTIRLVFNLGFNYGVFHSVGGTHSTCCINFLESFLIPITVGLFVSRFGLLLKRGGGLLLSLLGLSLGALSYFAWYRGTLSLLRSAELQRFDQLPDQAQKLLPLAGSDRWDV